MLLVSLVGFGCLLLQYFNPSSFTAEPMISSTGVLKLLFVRLMFRAMEDLEINTPDVTLERTPRAHVLSRQSQG